MRPSRHVFAGVAKRIQSILHLPGFRPTLGTRSMVALTVLFLSAFVVPAPWQTARAASNSQVKVVNLSDHDFWVEWYTDQHVTGSIQYGTSCADANTTSPESTSTGFVHLVDAGGPASLAPDTTYYFKLVDDGIVDDNGGQCYTVRTFRPIPSLTNPSTVFGTLKADPSCVPPEAGALVTIDVTHGGTTSLPLASATSADGSWSIPIGLATDAAGNLLYPASGDTMDVTAAAAPDDVFSTVTVLGLNGNGRQELTNMCLPNVPTPIPPTAAPGTPTATPTATPFPTATSTAIPTATTTPPVPTSTPTPLPTSTPAPSPTATKVRPTPRPTPRPTALPTHPPVPEPEGPSGSTGHTSHLKLKAYLVKATVARGDKQQMVVLTVSLAQVTIDVTYPNHGGVFHSSFKADKSGYWRRTWVVRTDQTGKATVLVTVVAGKDRRRFHRYFTVK